MVFMRPATHTPALTAGLMWQPEIGTDAVCRRNQTQSEGKRDAYDSHQAGNAAGDDRRAHAEKHQEKGAHQFRKIFFIVPPIGSALKFPWPQLGLKSHRECSFRANRSPAGPGQGEVLPEGSRD